MMWTQIDLYADDSESFKQEYEKFLTVVEDALRELSYTEQVERTNVDDVLHMSGDGLHVVIDEETEIYFGEDISDDMFGVSVFSRGDEKVAVKVTDMVRNECLGKM